MLKKLSQKFKSLYYHCVYQQFEEVVFKKDLQLENYQLKNNNVRAVEANREQIDAFLAAHSRLKKYRSRARNYFDNNFRATMALLNDQPIGYVWWTDAQTESPECLHPHVHRYGLSLGNEDVYGFDLKILPEHQGNNIASDFFYLYRRQLADLGYTTLWGSAEKHNLAAMWLHRMHRHEPVRTITSRKFLGRFLYTDSDQGHWYLKNGMLGRHRYDFRYLC